MTWKRGERWVAVFKRRINKNNGGTAGENTLFWLFGNSPKRRLHVQKNRNRVVSHTKIDSVKMAVFKG